MRLLRFRIRNLMIVVAIAGFESLMLATYPVVGFLLLGPLIVSPLVGHLSREPILGFLVGGLAGGLLETLLVALVVRAMLGPIGLAFEWDVFGGFLVMGGFAGFGVGWIFMMIHVLRHNNETGVGSL